MDGTEESYKVVHPCICGHKLEAHGEVDDGGGYNWDIDPDGNEIETYEQPYPRPVCWGCGPGDCSFIEMDNLEYLEYMEQKRK